MTIEAAYYVVGTVGNGTTTTFGLPWPIRAPSDVVVQLLDTTANPVVPPPTLNGGGTYDYVITGTPDPDTGFYYSGANIVFNHAPPTGYDVLYSRSTLDWQDKVFASNARFPAKSVEAALDRRTLVDQEQGYLIGTGSGSGSPSNGRIVQMWPYDLSSFDPVLPSTQGAAGMLLGENAAGTGWAWYSFAGGPILNIIGTANQITVSPATAAGQVQISLPTKIYVPANFSYASGGSSGAQFANYNSAGITALTCVNDLGNYTQVTNTGSTIALGGDNIPDAGYIFSNGSGGMVVGTNGPGILTFMINGVFVGKWRADGTLLVQPPGALSFNGMDLLCNANQNTALKIQNQNAGTQSMVSLYMQNNGSGVGSNTFLSMFGTNVASGGFQAPSRCALWTDGAGGLALATNAVAPLLFFINGNEVGRFDTNNNLGIGTAPASVNAIDILRNNNAAANINLVNSNAGTAAYAKVQFGNATAQSLLVHFGTGYATSGLNRADGCALIGAGAGGLTLATNAVAAQPIYFGIQGAEIARFDASGRLGIGVIPASVLHISQSNAGAFALAQIVNPSAAVNSGTMIQVVNDVGSAAQLMIYSAATGGGVGSTAILSATGSGGLYVKTAANAPVKFQVNNGNECGRWDTDSYLKVLGGYAGGIPTGNHFIYQTAAANAAIGVVHNATPTPGGGIQVLYSADPNNTGSQFVWNTGGYGTTYTTRSTMMSNGGIQNYSANNINLSDANLKDHIEPLRAQIIAKLWDAHRDMPWTRYRYKDQTHRDFNYGYLAQDIEKVFGAEFVEDLEQPEIQHPEKPDEKVKPTYPVIKGVYAEDIHNIGHALLSEAQRRIEKLEGEIAQLKKEKRK